MAEQEFINCCIGGMVKVTVKDGVITRMRPLRLTEEDGGRWTIEAKGKKFSDPRKTTINPFNIAERMRVYAENRIKYPMKRKNFDPNGERHPELRGKDEYVRISWDEALDIVTARSSASGRPTGRPPSRPSCPPTTTTGLLYYKMGPMPRFYNILGYTQLLDNPDQLGRLALGQHAYLGLVLALRPVRQLRHAGRGPEAHRAGDLLVGGSQHLGRRLRRPGDRHLARVAAGAGHQRASSSTPTATRPPRTWPTSGWLPGPAPTPPWPRPSPTSGSWTTPTTTGSSRTAPSTSTSGRPTSWARPTASPSPRSGRLPSATSPPTPSRRWPSSGRPRRPCWPTGSMYGTAGACRNSYATEWASLMIHLAAMRASARTGVNIWGGTAHGAPLDMSFKSAGYSDVGWDVFGLVAKQPTFPDRNSVTQKVYRILLPEAILDGHIEWLGEGFCVQYPTQQFKPMQYPEPGPNGAEIRMIHRHGGSFISTMTDTSKWVRMYQSPKLEFVVMQDCHWQSETTFGDVILPASTNFEHEDISEWAQPGGYGNGNVNCNHRILMYQQKCIEPLWESKPDYQIYCELAERLGFLRGVHRGQLGRRLDTEGLRLHRPAQAHLLRGVQEEGLLRGALAARGLQAHRLQQVVLRGPAGGHPRPLQPAAGHRQGHPDGHPLGQDRVRARRYSRSTSPTTRSGRPCRATSRSTRATRPRVSWRSTRSSS